MDFVVAIIIALTLVGFIQGWVYLLYSKTKRKKRALLPNLIILGIGLVVSALVAIFNTTMAFGWQDTLLVLLLSLTGLACVISTFTSALMMYVMDLKK
jgi:peptidoglycan/LPS O-acetylase OafA/YrhL